MKSKFSIAMIVMSVVFLIGTAFQSAQPWAVPDKNAKAVNPVKTSPTSIAAGKALYIKHCQECHGKKGLGDGTKVADLKTTPPDMTKASFQAQTDGAIFYKMSEGRNDMPRAKKELPDDEDRWNLVNYLRTFALKK